MNGNPERPARIDRWMARTLGNHRLMRVPIPLYRAGLGFLFGRRLVMIEHRGRTSGERRYVVVETVARTDSMVRVASGLGPKAQWYQNLAANGVAYISIGFRRRIPATPRLLSLEESRERLVDYAAEYPKAWQHLEAAMRILAHGEDPVIPLVDFELHDSAAARGVKHT
jgi:deazaflavin-dependent oxidoreductase (nitroreductase family)